MPSLRLTPDLFARLSLISARTPTNTGLAAFDESPERRSSFPYVTLTSSPKGSFLFPARFDLASFQVALPVRLCSWPFLYQRITCHQFEPDLVGSQCSGNHHFPTRPFLLPFSRLLFKRNCTSAPDVMSFRDLCHFFVLIRTPVSTISTLGVKKKSLNYVDKGWEESVFKRIKSCLFKRSLEL